MDRRRDNVDRMNRSSNVADTSYELESGKGSGPSSLCCRPGIRGVMRTTHAA